MVPDFLKVWLLKVIAHGEQGQIDLGNGATLTYELADAYWANCANDIRTYEPEMWFVADYFFKPDTVFIDCGANIGLWSCYAASKIKNKHQVIAVEPGSSILHKLWQNHALNDKNFTVMDKAIWSRSGENKSFMMFAGHASSSLFEDPNRKPLRRILVQTVSIDDIVDYTATRIPRAFNVVVKLDVEGAEQEAFAGAMRTLSTRNTLIIYEEIGSDKICKATASILKNGFNVYFVDCNASAVRVISSIDEVSAIKTNPGMGYNFICCKPDSEFDREFARLCQEMGPNSQVKEIHPQCQKT